MCRTAMGPTSYHILRECRGNELSLIKDLESAFSNLKLAPWLVVAIFLLFAGSSFPVLLAERLLKLRTGKETECDLPI
jgi:hypothetical protein